MPFFPAFYLVISLTLRHYTYTSSATASCTSPGTLGLVPPSNWFCSSLSSGPASSSSDFEATSLSGRQVFAEDSGRMASQPWHCPWCRKDVKASYNNCGFYGAHWSDRVQSSHKSSRRRRQTPGCSQQHRDYAGHWDESETTPWTASTQRQAHQLPRARAKATKPPARQAPSQSELQRNRGICLHRNQNGTPM